MGLKAGAAHALTGGTMTQAHVPAKKILSYVVYSPLHFVAHYHVYTHKLCLHQAQDAPSARNFAIGSFSAVRCRLYSSICSSVT